MINEKHVPGGLQSRVSQFEECGECILVMCSGFVLFLLFLKLVARGRHKLSIRDFAQSVPAAQVSGQTALVFTKLDDSPSVMILYADQYLHLETIRCGPSARHTGYQFVEIRFHELLRTHYIVKSKVWGYCPLEWLKFDTYGGPESTGNTTLKAEDDLISIHLPKEYIAKQFLEELTGWSLTFCDDASEHSMPSTKDGKAHITMWSKGDELRLLCKKEKKDGREQKWVSTSLTKLSSLTTGSPSTIRLKNNCKGVVLSKVPTHVGSHVMRSSILATNEGLSIASELLSQTFHFDDKDIAKAFFDALVEYVAPPSPSPNRRTSTDSTSPSQGPGRRRTSFFTLASRSRTNNSDRSGYG